MANRNRARAGARTLVGIGPAAAFNVFIPGGFESNMPAIVEWFRAQPSR